jgi:RNA polymerase sigma-70 factor (ECF subfamily)
LPGEEPGDLEAIYRRHADAVAIWAQRLGGPDVDLEDIVHDVFLVVQRRLPEWRGEAKITTWLYEITLRVVQQRRRRLRWLRWLPGRSPDVAGEGSGSDELADLPSDQSGPQDLLERREVSQTLYRILDGIGEKYRTVVILFELEGLSGEQIAAITGTSLANVWIRLHRAREKMARRLKTLALRGRL